MRDGSSESNVSNVFFLTKPELIPKSEAEKKEESRLTMKNVGEIFNKVSIINPDSNPVWASDKIFQQPFDKEKLNNYKPRIARLLIQLQPGFFKYPGSELKHAVNNKLQQLWDTSGTESKKKLWFWNKSKDEDEGVYASQLVAIAIAAELCYETTSMALINQNPDTPKNYLMDEQACREIIMDDDKKA